MTTQERIFAIETALMRAHCLSEAINFILFTDDDALGVRDGTTFRAAIEEVNKCAHEAVQTAIDHVQVLEQSEGGTP
jgi:hypothetical protein